MSIYNEAIAESRPCADCQGCPSCPEYRGTPIEDTIAEKDDHAAGLLYDMYLGWGYSKNLAYRLAHPTPPEPEPPADIHHVRPITFRHDTDRLPAILQRDDGSTLLYANKLNSIFGEPGTGKSWIALVTANETLLQGGRVMFWDFEDNPDTLARRAQAIGALTYVQDHDNCRFYDASLQDPSETEARQAIADWLSESPLSLVVIDAAESAGCPSDGSDVVPWFRMMVDPWLEAGAAVIVLDHVPKRREDRARGGIGSQHKLARIDGAALYVSGTPWNKQVGGGMKLTVHKDRPGDLPASVGKQVAMLKGEHKDGILRYSIVAGGDTDDDESVADELLYKIAATGFDGVKGARGIRELIKGRGKATDAALVELMENGLVSYTKMGNGYNYAATAAGLEVVGG